jgi:hypothetical protein
MGDHTSETLQQLQSRQDDEAYARAHILGRQDICLDEDSIPWILSHIDCFVSQSRGNQSIKRVHLCLLASFGGYYNDEWDKIGQAIGNLQALERLRITTCHCNHDEDSPTLDWEILARILSHVRQRIEITLAISTHIPAWRAGDIRSFAGAIRGHPTITSFDSGYKLPYESMDSLYSALVTLPALESIVLSNSELLTRADDESTLATPESLTELLRVPSLRYVSFEDFDFTPAICQATANAFMEGTAVTKLELVKCSFPDGECATILASGLSRNTSVASIGVMSPSDEALHGALAAALPSNSTLRHLVLDQQDIDDNSDLSPLFLALGKNTGLKSLKVAVCESMNESLCTVIHNGLGANETLVRLDLSCVHVTEENSDLWRRALSFLRTNKTLKSFEIGVQIGVTGSLLFTLHSNIAAMLHESTSLESLSIQSNHTIEAEEYFLFVTALQHNTTLKTLNLYQKGSVRLTDDQRKVMAALLKKNYALESLSDFHQDVLAGDVGAILRLNGAGRRYLIEDGSSISKGVEVLSAVSEEINCVFLHLLENPRLCDRSAVEIVSTSENKSSR